MFLSATRVLLCVVTLASLLRYIAYDFHKECSKMRWHRLQILVDDVSDMQDEFGFVFISVPFYRKDCGLRCCHCFTLIWFLNADSAGISW